MTVQADHIIRIGADHELCEDYALSGALDGGAYALVADGCSGAGDTDLGARLIAWAAKKHLRLLDAENPEPFAAAVAATAAGWLPDGVGPEALDATLIVALWREPVCQVVLYGDGYVLTNTGEDQTLVHLATANEAPFYPNYRIEPGRKAAYLAHPEKGARLHTVNGNGARTEDWEPTRALGLKLPTADLKSVAVATDGIGTFRDEQRTPVPVENFFAEFLAFKTTAGSFLKRRAGNGLLRRLAGEGIRHYDDLAVAALAKGEVEDGR